MKAILRRFRAWAAVVLGTHAIAFLLLRAVPGGPFDQDRALPPEVLAALRSHYHLDESWPRQYLRSLWDLLHGDFGPSLRYLGTPVSRILGEALPVSAALGAGALLIALLIGIPAGLWAARRAGRAADHAVLAATTLTLALPNFVIAGLGIVILSFGLGWLPPALGGGPSHYLLPCLSLGLPFAAQVARLTRNGAREALAGPALRTARAKGLPERSLIRRHVLPLALVPVVAFLGPATAGLLTGSLVIEQVFALPGLGTHFVQAALNRDYTLALGVTVLYTALLGACTFLADVLLERLDPRIRALR